MQVTEQMMADQDKRLAAGIADVSNGIEALRAENRKLRDALFQFQYPIDPKTLREIADEIDCGNSCEFGNVEWDTNAHNCSRENRAEGCAFNKACELRQLAEAIETQTELTVKDDGRSAECA